MTPDQIRARVQQDKVDYLLAQFVDIHGTPRCKGVPARALDLFLEGSAGFAGAAVWGMGQGPHDHDMIALPDLASYTLVPGRPASPASPATSRSTASPGPTARGPRSAA